MPVGYSIGKGDLDLALGDLATSTRDMVARGQQVLNVLSGLNATQLANMGYTPADVTLIQNTQTDIQTLIGVIQGTGTLAAAHNFLTNLSQMYGTR